MRRIGKIQCIDMSYRIAVVGGGPAGLTFARVLYRHGPPVALPPPAADRTRAAARDRPAAGAARAGGRGARGWELGLMGSEPGTGPRRGGQPLRPRGAAGDHQGLGAPHPYVSEGQTRSKKL